MSSRYKSVLIVLALVGFIGTFAAGFGAGWIYALSGSPGLPDVVAGRDFVPSRIEANSPDLEEKFDVFWKAWDIAQTEYYGRPVDEQDMVYGATKGMLEALGDDYTTFVDPDTNKLIEEEMQGSFEGIGVVFQSVDGLLTVMTVFPDSPAEKAGMREGDIVVEVNGESIEGFTVDEAVPLIKGPKDTKVTLSIIRPATEESLELVVTRAEIETPSVRSWMLDGDIAYIRVLLFGQQTTEELDEAIVKAQQENAKGIVLDLRNNGGGYVRSAQEMLGRFLPEGIALYEETAKVDGRLIPREIITGEVKVYDMPVVVLVNQGTASSSEIVAGALQDAGRAKLVGVTTFGKGSVQEVETFDDGSSARVTVAHWLTPKKRQIQDVGLKPDIEVVITEEDIVAERDPQLDRAQQEISNLVGVAR